MEHGYFLIIPRDADVFLKDIANANKTELTEYDVYKWIVKNIQANFLTCIFHLIMAFGVILSKITRTQKQREFINFMIPQSEKTLESILTAMNIKY
jgi:hypothetical protein